MPNDKERISPDEARARGLERTDQLVYGGTPTAEERLVTLLRLSEPPSLRPVDTATYKKGEDRKRYQARMRRAAWEGFFSQCSEAIEADNFTFFEKIARAMKRSQAPSATQLAAFWIDICANEIGVLATGTAVREAVIDTLWPHGNVPKVTWKTAFEIAGRSDLFTGKRGRPKRPPDSNSAKKK